MDVSEDEIREMVNEEFIEKIITRFKEMYQDLGELMGDYWEILRITK